VSIKIDAWAPGKGKGDCQVGVGTRSEAVASASYLSTSYPLLCFRSESSNMYTFFRLSRISVGLNYRLCPCGPLRYFRCPLSKKLCRHVS